MGRRKRTCPKLRFAVPKVRHSSTTQRVITGKLLSELPRYIEDEEVKSKYTEREKRRLSMANKEKGN